MDLLVWNAFSTSLCCIDGILEEKYAGCTYYLKFILNNVKLNYAKYALYLLYFSFCKIAIQTSLVMLWLEG